jgi:hypothetical protein
MQFDDIALVIGVSAVLVRTYRAKLASTLIQPRG